MRARPKSALFALLLIASPFLAAEVSDGEKLFALHVSGIIQEKCIACHSPEPEHKLKGGLDLSTRETLMKGGDSGEVIVLGNAKTSLLYLATTWKDADYEMPPKEADRLSDLQMVYLKDWINAGAPWVEGTRLEEIRDQFSEGVQVTTSKALSDDWQNRRYQSEHLWAYRPLTQSKVPKDQHPIDFFLDARLSEIGIDPAPAAEPVELLRRLTFNLTGLPPRPAVVAQFRKAYQADPKSAIRDQVSTLLDSPHYGEQFGRHWLDVARYADSAGFANDYSRPNAWRYRDYVIRSFQSDKPYDQFVREQIAGDEIAPNDPEHRIATGFLRMGAWEQTGMSVFKVTRQQWIDDVTDSVGQTFLGHAMQCAKCHDHKFDPVPTRDYYRMAAVFSTTQFVEPATPFLPEENKNGFEKSAQLLKAKNAAYSKQSKGLDAKVQAGLQKEKGKTRTGENGLDPGDEASRARIKKNIVRHNIEMDRSKPYAFAVYTGNTISKSNIQGRIAEPKKGAWGQGYLQRDTILTGGDVYTEGSPVKPGALSAAESLGGFTSPDFPAGKGARRTALAEWITHPGNPLTARVIVNRVWAWHFGAGLAGNPNNFGGTGALPTHPQLLDYLANWFMENGWSIKKLNTLITTSDAYRRSSRHPDPSALAKADPNGTSLAVFRPRRLVAEEFRDAMLFASSELNPQVGGIPARPDINAEVAFQPLQIMGGTASVYEPDPRPEQRNRRTVYAERLRGLRDPFLETFNQPGSEKSCELRDTSTVAPQALTLFNTQEVHDRSLALAAELLSKKDRPTANQTVSELFLRTLSRPPSQSELEACLTHWKAATQEEKSRTYQAPHYPTEITRTVMAEKTGEPYSFQEHLPTYLDYVPDLGKHQVDAQTRGLAEVCLVLFNTNEFGYLD